MTESRPEVLFVCVHNAGRSQTAATLVRLRSDTVLRIRDKIDARVQALVAGLDR